MKTTIDLPEKLLNEAMQITGSKTKIDAIKKALQSVIDQEKRKRLINFKGKIDLDIDLDVLRNRNFDF
jgi:Arc/MetJ family transcription regulator